MRIVNLCAPENFGVPLWAVFGPERSPSLVCVRFVFSGGVGPAVESVHGDALPGMVMMFGGHLPMLASEWAEQQGAVYFSDHDAALDCIRERTATPPVSEPEAEAPPAAEPVQVAHLFVWGEPARRAPDQVPALDPRIITLDPKIQVFRYRRR